MECSVPFGLKDIPFSNRNLHPKTELFRSDFGRCQNTQPSVTGPNIKHLRTESVWISDIDYLTSFIIILDFHPEKYLLVALLAEKRIDF